MTAYTFTLILTGPVDEKLDDLYDAGLDDALIGEIDGVPYAEFDREAENLRVAIGSAMHDVATVDGIEVERVEPDDLVTAAEIAQRLGRTRESVRLLIAGKRGPGDFPAPATHLRDRNRLWRWTDVARWAGVLTPEDMAGAVFVAALNALLAWRRTRAELGDDDRERVIELVG